MKGLLAHEAFTGGSEELRAARRAGEEYLLQRRLTRRLSTGELVGPWVGWFDHPFRWVCSALHATDYFRSAALLDGAAPDPRLADAVEVVRAARRPDGTGTQEGRYAGEVWFEVDVALGEPSPWLTFFGTCVLAWWDVRTTLKAAGTGRGFGDRRRNEGRRAPHVRRLTIILVMTTTTSLADAKAHFSEIVSSAESTRERTVVTKNGRPVAVVMSLDELESLEETLDVLSDPDAMADLRESRISFARGLSYQLGETDAEMQARMGPDAFATARAAVRADLLVAGDIDRARRYEPA